MLLLPELLEDSVVAPEQLLTYLPTLAAPLRRELATVRFICASHLVLDITHGLVTPCELQMPCILIDLPPR